MTKRKMKMFKVRMRYEVHTTFSMPKIFPVHTINEKNFERLSLQSFQNITILFGLSQGLHALIIASKENG